VTAAALYEIETIEAGDGTTRPAEHLWTPSADDAAGNGFVDYRGLHIAGVGGPADDAPYPEAFITLGRQLWSDVIEAAAAYMDRIHAWRNLHLYPGDDPTAGIPRIPRAVHTHAVFLRHPHPDHPCGCERDGTWRLAYTPPTEPGAVPITAMRHPAAPPGAGNIPDPDHDAPPAAWAP
jgi:hypothetical protein